MGKVVSLMAGLAMGLEMDGGMDTFSRPSPPKPPSKCKLPGCEATTTHNGGYCCAEHCKQHSALRRKNE